MHTHGSRAFSFLCSPDCSKQPRTSFPFINSFIQPSLVGSLVFACPSKACKWRLKVLNHDRRNEKKSNREVWLRTFQTYFTFFPYSFEMLKWILFGYLKPPLNATIWMSEDTFLTCVILTWFCFHLERSIYVPISFCSVFSLFFCYRPFIST